jgi:hypothetical protein
MITLYCARDPLGQEANFIYSENKMKYRNQSKITLSEKEWVDIQEIALNEEINPIEYAFDQYENRQVEC